MMRPVLALLALASFASPAKAQSAFDPEPVAYVLCVTNETKKRALIIPPIAKDVIVAQAFAACSEDEALLKKSLAEKGAVPSAIDARLAQIKIFIRQTAEDDIDRFRVNARPR